MEARLAVVVLSNSATRIEDIGFHMLDQRAELTEKRHGLVAEATGLGIAPIYPATETEFFVKVIPVELTFQLDPRGAATGVVVRFAGRQMRGSKVR